MVWIRKISVRIAVLLNILLFTVSDIRSAGVEAGKTEPVQDTVDAKGETEEGENGAEPYIFTVRKLDEVRLEGKASEDFRITNTANDFGIYYVDDGGDLYACRGYKRFLGEDEDGVIQLIARNVVHVDCCSSDITVFLTQDGKLYGFGEGLDRNLYAGENGNHETPRLLMEGVRYVRCGYRDLVIMKEDSTVWVWGTLSDGYYGGREEKIPEPVMLLEDAVMITGTRGSHAALLENGKVYTWGCNAGGECGYTGQKPSLLSVTCVAENVQAVWMGMLQYNICCTEWEKWIQYDNYPGGEIGDCLVIRKQDGSLLTCGGESEGEKEGRNAEKSRPVFVPCQIVQEPCIRYEGVDTYRHILEKYELAWNGDPDTVNGWKITDGTLFRKSVYSDLSYSLKDLTGDGTEELIIGLLDVEKQRYSPRVIYSYDTEESRIVQSWDDQGREITIYEGGCFELVWGSAGVAYYVFYQLEQYSGVVKEKIVLSSDQFEEGGTGYYIGDADSGDIERKLTEEEFNRIRERYEAMPLAELEWKPLG